MRMCQSTRLAHFSGIMLAARGRLFFPLFCRQIRRRPTDKDALTKWRLIETTTWYMLLSHSLSVYKRELRSKSIAQYETQAKHSPGCCHSSRWLCLASLVVFARVQVATPCWLSYKAAAKLFRSSWVWLVALSWWRFQGSSVSFVDSDMGKLVSKGSSMHSNRLLPLEPSSFGLLLSVRCKGVHSRGMAWVIVGMKWPSAQRLPEDAQVTFCSWIYQVEGVVHSVVDWHRLQLLDTVVGSPLITVFCCPVPKVALQYRQECCCCPVRHNSHYTECRCLTGIAHP